MKSILIIDDNKSIREMLDELLGLSYQTTTASDGQEGLDVFTKQDFDLVLCDVCMPVMDGLECLKEIKQRKPDTRVIMMSGYNENSDNLINWLRNGKVKLFTKAF